MCGTSRAASARSGQHLAKEKISGLERGASYLLDKVSVIGPHTRQWAEAMLHARGIEGTRVLQGLLGADEEASQRSAGKSLRNALSHGCYRLRTLRQLLAASGRAASSRCRSWTSIRSFGRWTITPPSSRGRSIARQDRPSVGEGFERHGWAKARAVGTAHEKSLAAPSSTPPGSADLLSAQVRLSLAGLLLSRARLRFTGHTPP